LITWEVADEANTWRTWSWLSTYRLTVYDVMGLPPSSGADQDTVTWALPAFTVTPVGVDGTVGVDPASVVVVDVVTTVVPGAAGAPIVDVVDGVVDVVDELTGPVPTSSAPTGVRPGALGACAVSLPGGAVSVVGDPAPTGEVTSLEGGIAGDAALSVPAVTAPVTTWDAAPTRPSTATVCPS
jgi:hypothetical protein